MIRTTTFFHPACSFQSITPICTLSRYVSFWINQQLFRSGSDLDFTLGSKKFSSLHDLKGYLDNYPLSPVNDNGSLERSSDTICSSPGDDLVPLNNSEFTNVLLALCQKHGQNYAQNDWQLFYTNYPNRLFFAVSNTGQKFPILYKDHLLSMQEAFMAKAKESREAHFGKIGSKIVEFICTLLREFPLSSPVVLKTVFDKFPYKKLPLEHQHHYFKTTLAITSKFTNVEERAIGLCVEKFLQIDVDARTHWRNTIILDTEQIQDRINKYERKVYHETEKKINIILELIIEYLDQRVAKAVQLGKSEIEEFTDMLLKIFEDKIMASYKSNYIQYILLYLASIPELEIFRQKFVSLLLIQSSNPKEFREKRIVFLNYFASFIGISNFLEPELIIEAMRIFLAECYKASGKMLPYMIQALVYILCYKYDALKTDIGIINEITNFLFVKKPEMLCQLEPNMLSDLLNLIKLENLRWKKPGIAAIEATRSKQTAPFLPAYWFFAGVNYLPVIKQKLEGKLVHLTLAQRRAKQIEMDDIVAATPKITPKKLLGKKRRDSFEQMDGDTCVKQGLRLFSVHSPVHKPVLLSQSSQFQSYYQSQLIQALSLNQQSHALSIKITTPSINLQYHCQCCAIYCYRVGTSSSLAHRILLSDNLLQPP
eukprot:TRINITY_DN1878_c0_g1_i2.p1 TRINITY_DN1878_c0_g1~~TRINITY_DN1878_c0_g1_i2.p1  ORF type:complete len:654 (+),score=32.79 TRINITY_DN1878_c0_g1_i2:546-2507(+)